MSVVITTRQILVAGNWQTADVLTAALLMESTNEVGMKEGHFWTEEDNQI